MKKPRARLLYKVTSSPRFNAFHYHMFHGHARRAGIDFPDNPSHTLGADLSDPLVLDRNGRHIPPVFLPSTTLVVSESVKAELPASANVVLLPVKFGKLVDYPYQAGDFSYYDRPAFRRNPRREDPETLIERLPNVPVLHERAGRYYEVVVAWQDDVAERYADLAPVAFTVDVLGAWEDMEVRLSPTLLEDCPILVVPMGLVLSNPVWEKLQPHLDMDYFRVAEGKEPA
jgi:hypothetical protein